MEVHVLKNIDWKTLLLSKTFWAGMFALGSGAAHAYGVWIAGNKGGAIVELGVAFSAFLAAIGIKDATSGPIN